MIPEESIRIKYRLEAMGKQSSIYPGRSGGTAIPSIIWMVVSK
jgi:hypothetical protein